eukprot:12463960-Alexandrium_andersonii.AAC.1
MPVRQRVKVLVQLSPMRRDAPMQWTALWERWPEFPLDAVSPGVVVGKFEGDPATSKCRTPKAGSRL